MSKKFLLLLGLLFLSLRLPSLFEPYWYGDEGIYLTLGQGIRSGLTLYSQIHDNKPPTLYYLAAIAQTVFGFRLLLALWLIPTIVLFYRLCHSRLATTVFLILTSIPLVEGNIANSEIFMLLPTIVGIILFLHQRYWVAGLFLGFAFTLKVPAAAELGLLLFWLLFFNFQNLKLFLSRCCLLIAGFGLPIFLWGFYFYLRHALPQFLYSALLQNFGYISSWTTGSHSGSITQGGLATRLVLLLFSLVIIWAISRRRLITTNTAFVLAWFAVAVFGSLLSARPYPHYLIQVVPPLCWLLALALKDRRLLLAPLVLLLIVLKYKFYFYPSLRYYYNFYSYALHLRSTTVYRNCFGTNVNTTYQLADYLRQHSQPSDRIFIWGDEPYVFPLSQRLPATKYIVAYHIVDFKARDSTINQLKVNPPQLIVYFSNSSRPYSQLDEFLGRYYLVTNQIGSSLIFQLRHD